jgi:hypothetical protein
VNRPPASSCRTTAGAFVRVDFGRRPVRLVLAAGSLAAALIGCGGAQDVPEEWPRLRAQTPVRFRCYLYEQKPGRESEEWSSSLVIDGNVDERRIDATVARKAGIPGGPEPFQRRAALPPAQRDRLLTLVRALDLKLGDPPRQVEKDGKKVPVERGDLIRRVRVTLYYPPAEAPKDDAPARPEEVTGRPVDEKGWIEWAHEVEKAARRRTASDE